MNAFLNHVFRLRYSLRISVCDDWGRVKLAFDLEVVALKTKQLGIRRKRVKGDTWHYKKYCEDVIRSANVCFSDVYATKGNGTSPSAQAQPFSTSPSTSMANSTTSNYSHSTNNNSTNHQHQLLPT